MENDILEITKWVQRNNADEAKAISDYSDFLSKVYTSTLEKSDKDEIFEIIEEIIADELNHMERLKYLYVKLTEIQPMKN